MTTLDRFIKVYKQLSKSNEDLDSIEINLNSLLSIDLGIDSLKKVQLGIFLEDEFQITLDNDFLKVKTVREVINYIDSRLT